MCVTHIDVKCVPYDTIPLALWLDSEREALSDIITRTDNLFLNPAPQHEDREREEEQADAERAIPNKQKDDLAQRRAQSRPLPQKDGPTTFVGAHMSQADMQKWERLKMTEPRCPTHAVWYHIHKAHRTQKRLPVSCVIYQRMSVSTCVFMIQQHFSIKLRFLLVNFRTECLMSVSDLTN